MKTSIKIGLATFLVILSFCTMADGRPVKRSIIFSMAKQAIHHYMDVITEGQYNCQTTLQIIDECAHYMIAKVIMKFESFTKIDLITLINEDGNWKVIASIHTYQ